MPLTHLEELDRSSNLPYEILEQFSQGMILPEEHHIEFNKNDLSDSEQPQDQGVLKSDLFLGAIPTFSFAAPVITPVTAKTGFGFSGVIPTFSFGSGASTSLSTPATASTIANPFSAFSSTGSTTSSGFGSQSSLASSVFPTAALSSSTTSTTAASGSGFGFGSLGSSLSPPAKETSTGFGMGGLSFGTPAPAADSGGPSLGLGQSTTSGFGPFIQSSMSTDPFALLNKPPSFGFGFNAPSPQASSSMVSESEPSPMSAFGSSFSSPLSVTQVFQPMANPFALTATAPSPFITSTRSANPIAQTAPSANLFADAAPVAANPFDVSNPAFGGAGFGSSFSTSAFGGGSSFGSSLSAAPAPAPTFGQPFGASAGFGAPSSGGFAVRATKGFGAAPATSGFGTAVTTSGFGTAPATSSLASTCRSVCSKNSICKSIDEINEPAFGSFDDLHLDSF